MPVEIVKRRFTVDDYQRMGETGILAEDDRVELIDGVVVAMSPIGSRHNACADRAARAMFMAVGDRGIVRVQGSVRLNFHTEPQPDLAVLRPQVDFYASRLPGPGDIFLIVEIAASSIDYDRELKGRIYAEAGVPEYWLADLNENVLTCYSDPQAGAYRNVHRYRRGESVAPRLLPECTIAADVVLTE